MKIGFKTVSAMSLVFALSLSIVGCGSSSSNSSSNNSSVATSTPTSTPTAVSTEKPKEVVTLKLTMFADWYQKGWQAVEKDVNDNADKLGFKLDIDKIAGGAQGLQVLKTRAATGDMPDVLAYPGVDAVDKDLHIVDQLADLTSSDWTKNYEATFLKSVQYTYTGDGKLYGAPLGGVTIPGVFYNKKVFSDLGLSIPNTWTEYLNVCEKVKAAGKTPIFMAGKDAWTVQIFNIMGLQREFKGKDPIQGAKDLSENKVNITNLALFKDSYAKLKELKDKGYFQKNWLSDNYDSSQKALAEGSAAMVINATWMLDEITKKYPNNLNDIGAFTVPFDGDDVVGAWMPNGLFAFKESKNLEAAKEFINYFESVDTQNLYYSAQPGIPAMTGLKVEGIAPAAQDLYKLFTTPGRGQTIWQSAGLKPDLGPFDSYSMYVLVNGKTPDQAVAEARKAMEKSAKSLGLAGW